MKIEIEDRYINWVRSLQPDITDEEIVEIVNESMLNVMYSWQDDIDRKSIESVKKYQGDSKDGNVGCD